MATRLETHDKTLEVGYLEGLFVTTLIVVHVPGVALFSTSEEYHGD